MTEQGLQKVLEVLKEKLEDYNEQDISGHIQLNEYEDPLVLQVIEQFEGTKAAEWKEFLEHASKTAVRIAVTSREGLEIMMIGDRVKLGFEKDSMLFVIDDKVIKLISDVTPKVFNTEIPTLRDATLLAITMYTACGLQEFYTMREPFIDWMKRVARVIGLEDFDYERAVGVLQEFRSKEPFDFSYLLSGGGNDGNGNNVRVFGGLFGFNSHAVRCNGSGIDLYDYFDKKEYEKRKNFTVMYWMGVLALVGNGCFLAEHTVFMRLQPNIPAVPLLDQDDVLEDLEKFEEDLCTVV